MRLCWDNIENIRLTKRGNFRDMVKKQTYHYNENCKQCGEPFLYISGRNNGYCSKSCSHKEQKNLKGKNHPSWKGGYKQKGIPIYNTYAYQLECCEEVRRNKQDVNILEVRCFICSKWFVPTLNNVKNRIQHLKGNKNYINKKSYLICSKKCKSKHNKSFEKRKYWSKNIPTYDTYVHQIEWCEKVRRNKSDPNILEVKCFKCGKWFIPKSYTIKQRIQYLKGNNNVTGEHRFYCSKQCKNSCSISYKPIDQIMKEDAIRAGRLPWLELTREVQPELRQMVLERDNNECIKCGSTEELQCHHILPVNIEPLLSADIDNCITLCYNCHKKVHQKDGCKYNQLKLKEC